VVDAPRAGRVVSSPRTGDGLARPRAAPRRLVALSAAFGAIAAAPVVLWIRHFHALPGPFRLPWLLVAIGFAAAERFPIDPDVGEGSPFPLIELPLVLGLFFVSPLGLVGAWMVGRGISVGARRGPSPAGLLASVAFAALQATSAVLGFHVLLGAYQGVGPMSWGPALAAALLATLVGAIAVGAARVAGADHGAELPPFRGTIASGVIAPLATTTVALAAAALMWSQPKGGWLVLGVGMVMWVAHRSYAGLRARHSNLVRLHEFSRLVEHSTERIAALQSMLSSTRQLLGAETAELVLIGETSAGPVAHSVLRPGGDLETKTVDSLAAAGPLWERAIGDDKPIRVRSFTRSKKLRAELAAAGHRDAMVVPLRRNGRIMGAIAVADRIGEKTTFKHEDLRFLEALAEQAAVMLEKSSVFNRLQLAAWHDELTGLTNRAAFNEQVIDAIKARTPGTKVALLLMDLDRFKEVNDTLGHHQGDRVLIGVALRLSRALRSPGTLARLGGDEFAVLLTDLVDDEEPAKVAQRLRRVIDEPFLLGDLRVSVGATVGIALCPDHGEDVPTLLQRADVAMYSAKGGGGVATYSAADDSRNPVRLALVNDLRRAIERDELELYYQPQAELGSGAVVGAEALLRWNHPEAGAIAPQEFVEVAERSDLIRPLTLFVLRTATLQWRAWLDAGLDVAMSVKLSVRNLVDPDLKDDIAGFLLAVGMPPSRLTLEITESVIMSDRKFAIVQGLAGLGVALSIGDFGTGVSSLAYLKRLPVRQIKIDKSFVRTMESDHGDRAIVHAVVDLGTNLGLRVVAEGVETQAALDLLTGLGCPVAQGYFLSPALPDAEFYSWTKARSYPVTGRDRLRLVT
jgi:diguanylate cyclase (GGDEF)-like protein